ncbi:uncharacterized protein LOC112637041 [Camponotus floridanus]|uniref:uncharacterized protein LOC112637041 n=1 Tax=Camponotus floridanus TaxID=104421 RepID=UPI000DC68F1B|nr:uncharacterized protein LOC112637041 [Camponotus floridanus]XP_025267614.1 uncharacterized protein LOC112637041 [Camponotus floridanus]
MTDKFYAIVEFEDGLQVIPNNWLSGDLKKAFWPNFTNNKRYDKAVKLREEPEYTWLEHPIRKIYGTFQNYGVARKKLKDAEELSDINSGPDIEENLKRSRKIRAAKIVDETSNDTDESLDEMIQVSEIPKFPNKHSMTAETSKTSKITENASKNVNNLERKYTATQRSNIKKFANINTNIEKGTDDSSLHCNKNLIDAPVEQSFDETDDEVYVQFPIQLENKTSSNLSIHKQALHCNGNVLDASAEQLFDEVDEVNANMPIQLKNKASSSNSLINKQESEPYERFVIHKLISLELKLNSIERCQKLILKKISIDTFEAKEKETIDIYQDLPLKTETDLQSMENKLNNDSLYRNEMVKQLVHVTCQDLRTSCIRLMKIIFANKLAINYSWYGAKKKENFSKLHICKVIMSAVRKLHINATDEQISAPIKIWLAHAKERMQRQTLNSEKD